MQKIDGLNQLYEAFRHCNSASNVLLYDPLCDLTFIFGERFSDLVAYLRGELPYSSLAPEMIALIIHERQHYLDLYHTPYGIRELLLFDQIVQRLAQAIEYFSKTDHPPPPGLLEGVGFSLFYESYFNTSAVQQFRPERNPLIVVGFWADVSHTCSMDPEPAFKSLDIVFTDKLDQSKVATVSVAEKSVVELSALGAEYLWRWAFDASNLATDQERNQRFIELEEDLFMMMHDFRKPDYLAAFHAAHIWLQQSSSDHSGNFPLLRSVTLGGIAARLAIYVVGTLSAIRMTWHSKLSALFGGQEKAAAKLGGDLCAVFYNILLWSKEIELTSTLTPYEWMTEIIQRTGLGNLQDILRESEAMLRRILLDINASSSPSSQYESMRIHNGLGFLERVSKVVSNPDEVELLMFFNQIHQIDWMLPLTNRGEPVLIQSGLINYDDADARVGRGLDVWYARAIMQNLRDQLEPLINEE